MNLRYLASLFLLLLWLPSCRESAASGPTVVSENRQSVSAQQNLENTKAIENIFTKETSLSYQGFTVTKLQKTVNIEGIKTKVSYAVLKKDEKVVANFDGLYHPMGNATQFGLFPFLGGEAKQLVVEQSIPRNWSHWIVNLVPDSHVMFDSRKWAVDGKLTPVDVNKDGIFEFTETLTTFHDFQRLPSSESPLIDVLFVYDANAREYVPSGRVFQEYALKGIDDEISLLQHNNEPGYLSAVVRIVLRYIYAGKRDEGWSFYEREYKLANKNLIKSNILDKLRNEPVYNFIYDR